MKRKGNIVTLKGTEEKFLIIENATNTLVSMVMLNEIDVYWLEPDWDEPITYSANKVTNPQTIFGASPNYFGIKIN